MYIDRMTKGFTSKVFSVKNTVEDVRETSRRIGDAAETQATLNIALTAVCVAALIVAALLVNFAPREGS